MCSFVKWIDYKLCESLGIKDGILFVQGIHNPQTGDFRVFEAGLRCAGEAPYRFLKEVTGQSFIHILADHALLGESDYDVSKDPPCLMENVPELCPLLLNTALWEV